MIAEHRLVRVAHAEVGEAGETLAALGLGSCVAIVLYDAQARVGGMAHVLLPEPSDARFSENTAKFASTAVEPLLGEMERRGAARERVTACLVGGASMFGTLLSQSKLHTGERNIRAARAALEAAGVPLLGEETGREHGRSVYVDCSDGRVRVTSYQHEEVCL